MIVRQAFDVAWKPTSTEDQARKTADCSTDGPGNAPTIHVSGHGPTSTRKEYLMRKLILMLGILITSFTATGADMSNGADNFYKSNKVTLKKVTFKNQYQMEVVANLIVPKDMKPDAKLPAIVVGHPMVAV